MTARYRDFEVSRPLKPDLTEAAATPIAVISWDLISPGRSRWTNRFHGWLEKPRIRMVPSS